MGDGPVDLRNRITMFGARSLYVVVKHHGTRVCVNCAVAADAPAQSAPALTGLSPTAAEP